MPPGYQGKVPEGYLVVRPQTFGNWVFWRSFLVDGDPKPGVDLVKKFTRIYPLSKLANPPEMKIVDISDKYFNTIAPADYTFWQRLNEVVRNRAIHLTQSRSAFLPRSAFKRASRSRRTRE